MVLEDLDSYMQKKNEIWQPTYTIHKNKIKMDKRLKYKSWYHKIPRGKHKQEKSQIFHVVIFTDMSPRATDIKEMGSHQN